MKAIKYDKLASALLCNESVASQVRSQEDQVSKRTHVRLDKLPAAATNPANRSILRRYASDPSSLLSYHAAHSACSTNLYSSERDAI